MYIDIYMMFHILIQGMLREQAEAQLGGSDKLQRAIERGAAIVSVSKGQEIIYLPNIRVGDKRTFVNKEMGERQKAISAGSFQTVRDTIQSLGWEIPGSLRKKIEASYT